MKLIGISGHQRAPEIAWQLMEQRLPSILEPPPFQGVSSLAAGADQIFAEVVLRLGGELRVVLPSIDYESTFEALKDLRRFEALLSRAHSVEVLDYMEPSEDAFLAAGRRIVDLCDLLVALWDGHPAKGIGGTADIVSYAQDQGKPMHVIWPTGVAR